VKEGLDRMTALKIAAKTVIGAGQLIFQNGTHPGSAKDAVTSPGGATIEGSTSFSALVHLF
jgi:pyrroline-5-carboxylate reductase